MSVSYLSNQNIKQFIKSAMVEDLGSGDHTSMGSVPAQAKSEAELLIKDHGLIAGLDLSAKIFDFVDSNLNVHFTKKDGDLVDEGDIGFIVTGNARSILMAERLVLNCLQRMSGIATYTRKLSDRLSGTKTRILDTRKTTPNFRLPEKWAVKIGGGVNHRFGLFDMVLIKDNHIDFAGGVTKAIESTKKYLKKEKLDLKIEVEVRNLNELDEVMESGGIHRVMLDNMLPSDIREAVKRVNSTMETEASGGINERNIREIAETGVDFISVGALTHSYRSLDISLKAK